MCVVASCLYACVCVYELPVCVCVCAADWNSTGKRDREREERKGVGGWVLGVCECVGGGGALR